MSESKKTLVIADGNANSRNLLKRFFANDYLIYEATDGEEALALLNKLTNIAVFLLNISITKITYDRLLNQMKESNLLNIVPTVVITEKDDEEGQVLALKFGAVDVITIPFNFQIIFQRINNVVCHSDFEHLQEMNQQYEAELRLADIDEKSGLYNIRGFIRRVQKIINENPNREYVLMRWDIDNFKAFNECFGSHVGDDYFKKVGSFYLKHGKKVPGLLLCCHLDADHFLCFREADNFNPEKTIEAFDYVFNKTKKHRFGYVVRAGLYKIEKGVTDVLLMSERAFIALKATKTKYNTRYKWYNDAMRDELIEEQQYIDDMEKALANDEFTAFYQPQFNNETNEVVGAEALLRWHHPQKGIIAPTKFLKAFESTGFITKLDRYIWEKICKNISKWIKQGIISVPIAINISRRDLYNTELADYLVELLEQYQIPSNLLCVEITEAAYLHDIDQLVNTIRKFQSRGIKVSIDDFGTGYSSINVLREAPADFLKMNIKHLCDENDEDKTKKILSGIFKMCEVVNIPVIVEGVETLEQVECLNNLGCNFMQGYCLSHPLSEEKFEKLLLDESQKEAKTNLPHEAYPFATVESVNVFQNFTTGAAVVRFDPITQSVVTLYANDKFQRITSSSELLQKSLLDVFVPEYREVFLSMLNGAVKIKNRTTCDLKLNNTNNNFVSMQANTIKDEVINGEYLLYLLVEKSEQLSNQKLLEKNLLVSESIPAGIMTLEISGRYKLIYNNENMPRLLGYTQEEFSRLFICDIFDIIHPDDLENFKRQMSETNPSMQKSIAIQYRHKCKKGTWRWVRLNGSIYHQGKHKYATLILIDINDEIDIYERNHYLAQCYRLLSMANGSMTFEYDVDIDEMHFTLNIPEKGFTERVYPNYVQNYESNTSTAPEDRDAFRESLLIASHSKVESTFEYRADYFNDNNYRRYRAVYISVLGTTGKVNRIIGRIDDIEEDALRQELKLKKAQIDGITGLANKDAARSMIEYVLSERPKDRFDAMLFIDLDNFKLANDLMGHIEGDHILKQVGTTIKTLFRGDDITARFGGDEFIIYITNVINYDTVLERAKNLSDAFANIFMPQFNYLKCCIGIAGTDYENVNYDSLLDRADKAMYVAKNKGKNSISIYGK